MCLKMIIYCFSILELKAGVFNSCGWCLHMVFVCVSFVTVLNELLKCLSLLYHTNMYLKKKDNTLF